MPPKAIAIIVQYRAVDSYTALYVGVGRALLLLLLGAGCWVLTEVRYENIEWTGVT